MYKTIAAVENTEDASDVYDELIDRYGNIPEPAANLIEIALVRKMAGLCGFYMVKQKEETVLLHFRDKVSLPLTALSRLVASEKGNLLFSAGKAPYLSYRVKGLSPKEALANVKILLQNVQKLQFTE